MNHAKYADYFSCRTGVGITCSRQSRQISGNQCIVPALHFTGSNPNFQKRDLLYISEVLRAQPDGHGLLVELYFDKPLMLQRRAKDMFLLTHQKLTIRSSTDGLNILGYHSTQANFRPHNTLDNVYDNQLEYINRRIHQEQLPSETLEAVLQIHALDAIRNEFHKAILPTTDIDYAYEFLYRVYRDFHLHDLDSELSQQIIGFGVYPTIHGMAASVHRALKTYLECLNQPIPIIASPGPGSTVLDRDLDRFTLERSLSDVKVLFNVAGSGKTKYIVNLLQRQLGYYILAGNIPPGQAASLYEPRRVEPGEGLNGSRDTWSLRQLLTYELTPWQSEAIDSGNIRKAVPCHLIKRSRDIVFQAFRQVLSGGDDPERWLRLQTSCNWLDPFDDVFQLLSLLPPNDLGTDLIAKEDPGYYYKFLPSHKTLIHYVCLDEAQVDLVVPVQGRAPVNLLQGMLESWCMRLNIVLSGTSLNIERVIDTIRRQEYVDAFAVSTISTIPTTSDTTRNQMNCLKANILSTLPMLAEDKDFTALLHQRRPSLHNFLFSSDMMPSVLRASCRLRGRYRWSAMFIDELELHRGRLTGSGMRNRSQHDPVIRNICQGVYDRAKVGLKHQLQRICQKKDYLSCQLVTQTLPNAAIWSHILDQPYIFPSSEQLMLVEYGFAGVERTSGGLKARLVERVAVDAIIDGFGGPNHDFIAEKLLQTLNELQDDAGGFGTKAERLFVWELRNCLRQRSPRDLIGFDTTRRDSLMESLAEAKNFNGLTLGQALKTFVSDYFLLEGDSISHKPGTGAANTMQLSDWLEAIRKGHKHQYAFLLPDEHVGPDVILVLKNAKEFGQCAENYILCFIQLKTGAKTLYGTQLKDALNTTVQGGFYKAVTPSDLQSNSTPLAKIKNAVNEELDQSFWRQAKRLSIMVTAVKPMRPGNVPDELAKRKLEEEYFVWLDEKATSNLFGSGFAELIREMKK